MEGWIKLHRAILDNDLWRCEAFTRGQAWVDLLLLANHKESFFFKRGNKVVVKRGQVGRSSVELSDRWRWSRTKVSKFLKDLEKEQQIIIHKSTVTQLITITNYDVYQEKEQQTRQQKNNRSTAEVQQKNTYKNDKKEKNDKEGEERSKDIVNVIDVCTFFQSETGKSLKIPNSDSKIKRSDKYKKINARLQEGATVEDCKAVIRLKNNEWKSNNDMKKYIQISTLFARANFEKYMDEILSSSGSTAPKTFSYELPNFETPEQRQFFFLAKYTKYTESGLLNNRLVNTEYRQRALLDKDAEGLCHKLEQEIPELLKLN